MNNIFCSISRWVLFSSLLMVSAVSSASIIAQKSVGPWDNNRPTHIIVAAKGLAFASVGYQQFKVYEELFPQSQFLFITNLPAQGPYRNVKQQALRRLGFQITEENSTVLNTKKFVEILLKNTANIRSLDIIGHNGVNLGPWLEDGDNRLDYANESLMGRLKPLFNKQSFARIQGCNSGWFVAPALSKAWAVPVLASFTSTSFYYLNVDGDYELFESIEGGKPTTSLRPSKTDKWSFNSPTTCPDGNCYSLKPESAPYHYHVHKSPEAAWLPMAKPICANTVSDARCRKALAESLITGISSFPRKASLSNATIFQDIVMHSVCGAYSAASSQKACMTSLLSAYRNRQNYLPYKTGEMLRCSGLRACGFKYISIDLRKNQPTSSAQTMLEYLDDAFLGYDLLNGRL